MKICFAGTPDFAVPMLEALLRSRHAVGLVVTQPDKPRGRGRVPWAPPVKQLAESRGVPVIQPESINRPEAVASLRAAAPDAIVVTAYGKRLGRRVLALPRLGCFNAHASLLPKYRGAAPIERAILCGESETGVTLQRMAPELDAGAILAPARAEDRRRRDRRRTLRATLGAGGRDDRSAARRGRVRRGRRAAAGRRAGDGGAEPARKTTAWFPGGLTLAASAISSAA